MKCTKIKDPTKIFKSLEYLDCVGAFIRIAIESEVFLIQNKINLYHTEIGDLNHSITGLPDKL